VNSLPIRQRRGCDLNPGPTAPESSTLTTRLPSHPARPASCTYTAAVYPPLNRCTAGCVATGNKHTAYDVKFEGCIITSYVLNVDRVR